MQCPIKTPSFPLLAVAALALVLLAPGAFAQSA